MKIIFENLWKNFGNGYYKIIWIKIQTAKIIYEKESVLKRTTITILNFEFIITL